MTSIYAYINMKDEKELHCVHIEGGKGVGEHDEVMQKASFIQGYICKTCWRRMQKMRFAYSTYTQNMQYPF